VPALSRIGVFQESAAFQSYEVFQVSEESQRTAGLKVYSPPV
jgi:hypothetical protein